MSHALERADRDDLPHAESATFAVVLDGRGLRLPPYLPRVADAAASSVPPIPPMPPRPSFGPRAGLPPGARPADAMRGRPVPDPDVVATIRTARMSLGDRAIGPATEWSVLGNTAQAARDPAGTVVEHHEIRGDGVELGWLLREAPPAGAAWTVELAVEGLDFRAVTDRGVHFADTGGTARVVIGGAVLVDATGERWPVPTELGQTAITLATGASVNGRLLAQTAVTLDSSTVIAPNH